MTSPVLARELPDGSRVYDHPRTRETAPSVTTVIAAGIPKPRLTGWSDRLAAEYADANWSELSRMPSWERIEKIRYAAERERERSSQLGTAVHTAAEAWGKGVPHEHSKEVDPYMNSFAKFLMDKRPVFLRNEVTVWSRTWNYAGTADAIARIGEWTWLIDFKTGKSLYPEVGLQLSALAHAEFIITPDGTEEEMPLINGLAAVHIRPRSWHFTPVSCDKKNFSAFLACRELYNWSTETAPQVLGSHV
jgi:hypothetical protein